MKKLYTNNAYIVYGYKLFTKLYGKVVDSKYQSVYPIGTKVSFPAEDFKELELDQDVSK